MMLTLVELDAAAREKRAVVVHFKHGSKAIMPAAFVMCMQAHQVLQYMRMGMAIYTKETKKGE